MTNKRVATKRTKNMQLQGVGASTAQDRSAQSTSATSTLHPYYNNNFFARWQEYVRWFETAWEARKLVNIPVQDALRIPVKIKGVPKDVEERLRQKYEHFNCEAQIRRALTQERLLGGSVLLGIFNRPEKEKTSEPLDENTIGRGDLKAINVIDISRISRSQWNNDPFSPEYDKVEELTIQGVRVHKSRMCILDGEVLFNRGSQLLMQNFRFNPCGFGESILAPLYDILVRATGAQQGAYHLINLASCLVIGVKSLRTLKAINSPAEEKIKQIIEQLSIYRGAVVDGDDVEFKPYNASFGSVPDLVMTFMQFLSAGSDIPATRFLGQAPGGLNATGESDLENYYNNVASWQQRRLKPIQLRILNWLGFNEFGSAWGMHAKELEVEYESLWNLPADRKATTDQIYAGIINDAMSNGLIEPESGLKEYVRRELFKGDVVQGDPLQDGDAGSPFGEDDDQNSAGKTSVNPKEDKEGSGSKAKPKCTAKDSSGSNTES
jgi:uncharacterized protein